jgi:hypothetical protein
LSYISGQPKAGYRTRESANAHSEVLSHVPDLSALTAIAHTLLAREAAAWVNNILDFPIGKLEDTKAPAERILW